MTHSSIHGVLENALHAEVVRVAPALDRDRRPAPDHVGPRAQELPEAGADEVVAQAGAQVVRAAHLPHHVPPEDEVHAVVGVEVELVKVEDVFKVQSTRKA